MTDAPITDTTDDSIAGNEAEENAQAAALRDEQNSEADAFLRDHIIFVSVKI